MPVVVNYVITESYNPSVVSSKLEPTIYALNRVLITRNLRKSPNITCNIYTQITKQPHMINISQSHPCKNHTQSVDKAKDIEYYIDVP